MFIYIRSGYYLLFFLLPGLNLVRFILLCNYFMFLAFIFSMICFGDFLFNLPSSCFKMTLWPLQKWVEKNSSIYFFFNCVVNLLFLVHYMTGLILLTLRELTEILLPKSHLPVFSLVDLHDSLHLFSATNPIWISEFFGLVELNDCPDVQCLFADFHLKSLFLSAVQEVSILAVVDCFWQEQKKLIIKFKLTVELVPKLMHTVKPLDKDGASIVHSRSAVYTISLPKHMTEWAPLFLYQNLEAIKCPVVRIKEKLDKRCELWCSVPTIRAVNQNCVFFCLDVSENVVYALKNSWEMFHISRLLEL